MPLYDGCVSLSPSTYCADPPASAASCGHTPLLSTNHADPLPLSIRHAYPPAPSTYCADPPASATSCSQTPLLSTNHADPLPLSICMLIHQLRRHTVLTHHFRPKAVLNPPAPSKYCANPPVLSASRVMYQLHHTQSLENRIAKLQNLMLTMQHSTIHIW
ncbi:hypothetical protein PoB_006643800 [Plakobranchus ocellatus]|uniref:Uncharacterized protein n=1 Tax=Plakobranchus ocellatus TaxID=259542 RepID=A0AAV4D6Y8_9GAST|nr:hypothetical protein PoB_006643800 [Plakobranchus ocellatus]